MPAIANTSLLTLFSLEKSISSFYTFDFFVCIFALQDIGARDAALVTACDPLSKNGSLSLNPCGLIANSFFTGQVRVLQREEKRKEKRAESFYEIYTICFSHSLTECFVYSMNI